jgi:2-oxoglutarate ferredoxin oxidoreductase subunit alpha
MPSVGEGFDVAVTGSTHDEYGIRFTSDPDVHKRLVERLNGKILDHAEEIVETETYNISKCEVGIVCFGCTSRSVYDAVELAEAKGHKVGYVRLKTMWPFPEKTVKQLSKTASKIIIPEMNLKQVFYEVQRVAGDSTKVVPLNKIGGGVPITPEEMLAKIEEEIR